MTAKPDTTPVEVDGIRAKRIIKTHDARGLRLHERSQPHIRITVENPSQSTSIDLDVSAALSFARSIASMARGEHMPPGLPHIVTLKGDH